MDAPLSRPEWLDESVWQFPIHTMPFNDLRVAYTDIGSGPTLFLLNAPQWSMVWRDVIAELHHHYRCVTLDPPGLGLSDRIPAGDQTLGTVRDAVVALTDNLALEDATLIIHDLGGLSGLAAASSRPEAFGRLAAVNTFGWRPQGLLLPFMLWIFGSAPVRWLDSATRILPRATSGRFGVGRVMNPADRAAFRRAFDRSATAAIHRMFSDASTNTEVHRQASDGLGRLKDKPALTVFGSWGDYLRFRRQWRGLLPNLTESTVPRGLHFPMNDAPTVVATTLERWEESTRDAANEIPWQPDE